MKQNFSEEGVILPVPANASLFEKRTVTELTDSEMSAIDGGTSPLCVITIITILTLIPGKAS